MIRIGLIGAGPNGSGNAKQFAAIAGRCRITAVADPVASAAAALADRYGALAVAHPAEFLENVDAVVISSPNTLHADQAVEMATAGKHLFIEKPMALSVHDADRVVAAVDEAGVSSMVGFSVRFDGLAQTMKARVDAGDVGELIGLTSRRLCTLDLPTGGWRSRYATSGGVMSELISHEIDFIVGIAGMPQTVSCRRLSRLHDDPRANDHVWLTLGFGDEATGTIEGSQIAPIADYYKAIVGTKGALHTRAWQSELYFGRRQEEADLVPLVPRFDKYAHFLDVIEGKAQSAADVHWARNIVLISEKALESAVTGQTITLTGVAAS